MSLQYHNELVTLIKRLIKEALQGFRPDLRETTGTLPGTQLPSGGPSGSGYPVAPHDIGGAAHTGTLTDALHGNRGGGSLHSAATTSTAGFLSSSDKTKLNGIASGATANDTDANLKNRANHTGTQLASTISDFSEATDDRVAALLVAGTNVTLTYNDGANTLTVDSSGGGGGSIDVTDGTTTVSPTTTFRFPAGTITDNGGDEAEYTPAAGSGGAGIWSPDYPPVSANALDDEFDDSSLDGKWTEWDPASVLTVSEEAYGLSLLGSPTSSYRLAGIYQTCPVGDFAAVAKVALLAVPHDYFSVGLFLGEDLAGAPTTSDALDFTIWMGASTAWMYIVNSWTSYTSISVVQSLAASDRVQNAMYLRMRRISTTLYFDVSLDGMSWTQRHSMTQPFTPGQIGVCVNGLDNTFRGVVSFFRVVSDTAVTSPILGARI